MHDFDVLIVSDFRLPGGTSHSTAQELAVHKCMGLRTGLVQSHSRLVGRPLGWARPILQELEHGVVEPVLPGDLVRADVAILRHPIAAAAMPDLSKRAKVDSAVIIANQPAFRPDGSPEYDPLAITGTVLERLGAAPSWAPIGPVVRKTLTAFSGQIDIEPKDWTNIFAQTGEPTPRNGFDSARPRIGRHSRPQPSKWPSTAAELLQAYPASSEYSVSILGGADPARAVLGRIPEGWKVWPFGAMDPSEFLDGVDFWVYFHHHDWSEAYGRAIMEALWSGAVAILPAYLEVTFGDAAVYGEPADVSRIISEFQSGERDFISQSVAGQRFARSHSPQIHVERLSQRLRSRSADSKKNMSASVPTPEVASLGVALSNAHAQPASRFEPDPRPRALFLTSNGAGMGHLTRMLGLARAVANDINPIFLSMSQGVGVVSAAGFPYEYVPFNSALQTKSDLWHDYLEDRLLAAVDAYQAEVVLFDGTWPYRGLLAALDQRDVMRVWIRRAMWKPSITSAHLKQALPFDLVLEPGDYAAAYDQGATRTVQDAQHVPPMTVLGESEILPREQARAALGLSMNVTSRYALVTLGAGNINDLSSTQASVLAAIAEHPGWEPVLTKAPIAAQMNQSARVKTVETFPLARFARAFDFAVSAAGYNSFTEWMAFSLPTVWIPNLSTMTDDQDARARWAMDNGYGLRALEGNDRAIQSAVAAMVDSSRRQSIVSRLDGLGRADGAVVAASLIREAWRSFRTTRGSRL